MMFGVIVSGQLVNTEFVQVGEKQFLTRIPHAETVNHIVVFLTGAMPLPEGTGSLVYFSLPDPVNPPAWHVLGYISNEKPSAIFRVSGLKHANRHVNADGTQFVFGMGDVSIEAQIGIAVDSLASIQQQCPSHFQSVTSGIDSEAPHFCKKMLENMMNYTMSFAITQSQMTPNPNETYIPLSSLQAWYNTFQRRLLQNPDFWKD